MEIERSARLAGKVFTVFGRSATQKEKRIMRIMGTVLMIIQVGVDYRGQNMVKFVQDEKYSTKSGDFLRFYAYFCHVIDDFACLDLQH